MKAFVLGAGMGTRLQPLTEWLPKPMVSVFHRPLISRAFDHLLADVPGLDGFIVNTHHCPEAYAAAFPEGEYGGLPLSFRHEPVLLETAGCIANMRDLLGDEPFLVYNGDILADLPLVPLLEAHRRMGNEVTLLLRSHGPALQVGLGATDAERSGPVWDIRKTTGRGTDRSCQFTGIYVVEPAFLERLTPGKVESVIPHFLDLIREGKGLGGCVEDEGHWWDLGDVPTYLRVHRELPFSGFPRYREKSSWDRVAASARVDPVAMVAPEVVVGPEAVVSDEAWIENSVLWPGAVVGKGRRCVAEVVRGEREVHFTHFFD